VTWDLIERRWVELRDRVREHFGRLSEDDLEAVAGRRERLVVKLQERYGLARDEAEHALREWESSLDHR
jgi:uncharacterized protein YjbJ (UPF0337 family)